MINEFKDLLTKIDESDPLWKKREHALQCKMVINGANSFTQEVTLAPIVASCLREQTHKSKISKASALSVAV